MDRPPRDDENQNYDRLIFESDFAHPSKTAKGGAASVICGEGEVHPPHAGKLCRSALQRIASRQIVLIIAYSVRNACMGSMRDALHAGTMQESAATPSNVAATAA